MKNELEIIITTSNAAFILNPFGANKTLPALLFVIFDQMLEM